MARILNLRHFLSEWDTRKNYIFAPRFGPVVQWIERKFPKLLIGVRFTSGLLL